MAHTPTSMGDVTEIAAALGSSASSHALRLEVGRALLQSLGADHLASFVWRSHERRYGSRVAVHMSDQNLDRYEEYFQFHDPVTPVMARQRGANIVDEVIPREDLERTEFYCDFLRADGLHHGLNFFAVRQGRQLGDLRIWRDRTRLPFTEEQRALLDVVGAALCAHLVELHDGLPCDLAELLTDRERSVAVAVVAGLSDGEIALRFGVSRATVRTHLQHICDKWNVRGRLGVIRAATPDPTPGVEEDAADHHI